MTNRDELGDDGVLIVDGREVPFTNTDFEIQFETSSSNFNDGIEEDSAVTGKPPVDVNVEADGSKSELKSLLMTDDGRPKEGVRALVEGTEGGDRFRRGRVTNWGRELPGDGKTTTSLTLTFDRHRLI